jgi:hypothetical protein
VSGRAGRQGSGVCACLWQLITPAAPAAQMQHRCRSTRLCVRVAFGWSSEQAGSAHTISYALTHPVLHCRACCCCCLLLLSRRYTAIKRLTPMTILVIKVGTSSS